MKTRHENSADSVFDKIPTAELEYAPAPTAPAPEVSAVEAVTSDGVVSTTALESAPVSMTGEQFGAIEAALATIAKMRPGVSLNAKYYEFTTEGDSVRGVFLGFRTIYKTDAGERKAIRTAAWIGEDKTVWINAGVTMCQQFDEIPVGTPVEIAYTSSVRAEMGKCKIYDVRPLY